MLEIFDKVILVDLSDAGLISFNGNAHKELHMYKHYKACSLNYGTQMLHSYDEEWTVLEVCFSKQPSASANNGLPLKITKNIKILILLALCESNKYAI